VLFAELRGIFAGGAAQQALGTDHEYKKDKARPHTDSPQL
jgi:hypothetical protein